MPIAILLAYRSIDVLVTQFDQSAYSVHISCGLVPVNRINSAFLQIGFNYSDIIRPLKI